MNQAELLCMENGKETALNERDSTVNCAKYSLAFFAQLETENVIFFFLAICCSGNTAYFSCSCNQRGLYLSKNTSLVNQRLQSPVMLRAVSPHSELLTPICFQESHPSRGWSLEGRAAAVKAVPIMSSSGCSGYLSPCPPRGGFPGRLACEIAILFASHLPRVPCTLLLYVPSQPVKM